jgi:hypothetical protein
MKTYYYVYTYTVPGESFPFYVGKGCQKRLTAHLSPCILNRSHTDFHNKVRTLLGVGIRPEIKKLAENLTADQAAAIEKYYIAVWGRLDLGTGCLCNRSGGGECGPESNNGTPIESYNLETGEKVKHYRSQSATIKDGYCPTNISACLRGKARSHHNLGWRLARV